MELDKTDNLYYLASPWLSPGKIPEIDEFLKYGKKKRYKKGEIIFSMGDILEHLFILGRGKIKIVQQAKNGTEKTFWFMNGKGFFGEVLFFHQKPSRAIAIAEENSEVYLFSRDIILQELPRHPQTMFYLLRLLSQKVRIMAFQLEDLHCYEPLLRVARLLFLFASQNGENVGEDTYIINVKLTHQEIANLTGLHRVTASNAIKKLEKMGKIKKERDKIVIPNLENLYEWIQIKEEI